MNNSQDNYLKTLTTVVIISFILVALFNWLVDPYSLFDTPRITNFNQHKTDLYKHTRMTSAHKSWGQAPKNILLGSSRSYFGFDSSAPLPNGQNYLNLAQPAGNLYEAYRYFLHVNQRKKQHIVLIGADMFMFNQHWTLPETFSNSRFSTNRYGQVNHSYWLTRFRELISALFTSDVIDNSFRTIHKQKMAQQYQVQGKDAEAISLIQDYFKHGARSSFLQQQQYYPETICPPPTRAFALGDTNDSSTSAGALRQLLRYAYANNIDIRIFISPAHAYLWEAMDMVGRWETFEEWKFFLVTLNEEEAANAAMKPFPLWDFSGYNTYTTEDVPADNEKYLMRWYWEASHFRPALGQKVLQRIFTESTTVNTDFGIRLNSSNISHWLTETRQARERYRASHTQEIKTMRANGITPAACHGNTLDSPAT